jgi:hypothetical protein
MTQVLTRPEFAGWTRAEWCLEMIQTALGYYTRPRPTAAGGDPASTPAAEPAPVEEPATETTEVVEEPEPAGPEPAGSVAPELEPAGSVAPELVPDALETVSGAPEPVADEPEPTVQADCPHPADARDYQSGTCAACGAILWD